MEKIFEIVKKAAFYNARLTNKEIASCLIETLENAVRDFAANGGITTEQVEEIINNPLKSLQIVFSDLEFDDSAFINEVTETMSPVGQRLGTKLQWAIIMAISDEMELDKVDIAMAAIREIYANRKLILSSNFVA